MIEILQNMDDEKRIRIINAAISEFALYPYEKASTNGIVKKAGISKGLIFHYFGDKRNLYEHVSQFVITTLFDEIIRQIDYSITDIFERIKQVVVMKGKLSIEYPQMFNFIYMMMKQEAETLDVKGIVDVYERYGVNVQEIMAKIYTYNIDHSVFKEEIDIASAINIIRWSLEKYSEEYLQVLGNDLSKIDFTTAFDGLDIYIKILKEAFYRSNLGGSTV